VRTGNLDATDYGLVMQRPIQQGGGDHADVDNIDTALGEPTYERIAQRVTTRPIVSPYGDGPGDAMGIKIRRISATESVRHLLREVGTHDATDVVLPEDRLADGHYRSLSKLGNEIRRR
jgi:hypothetical protein